MWHDRTGIRPENEVEIPLEQFPSPEALGEGLRLECVYYGLPGTGPGSLRLAARSLQLADRPRRPMRTRAPRTVRTQHPLEGRHASPAH
ncbi:hypothetical protein [Streptomyces sp. NPDC005799]|uniref:hypothetical protein n=1 Tax=Streptomyces sp. NPDC005799 TaxID=3154678 RepID=UPI0033F1DD60